MGLFSKKIYPEVWENYAKSFKVKPQNFRETRFVIFDTETTGLNTSEDRILSIGAITVLNQQICLNDVFECYVDQQKFSRDTVKIHGIRKSVAHKLSEEEALLNFIKHIENAVLVGHHIGFDIAMINQGLQRLHLPKLKNTAIDTGNLYLKTFVDLPKRLHYSLDDLAHHYRIPMHDRHNASGDAYITAQLFLKILNKLQKNNPLSISYLKRSAQRTGLL